MAVALCVVPYYAVLYLFSLRVRARASAEERAKCGGVARYAAACAAAGAPAPFRGPAADSPLGEHFLDVAAIVSASALEAAHAR